DADIMSNDSVKHIRSIGSCRRTFAHYLLDLIDAVLASVTIKAISLDRGFLFCSFTSLAPYNCPIKYLINVAELADCRLNSVSSYDECLIGAPEQLSGNLLAVDF